MRTLRARDIEKLENTSLATLAPGAAGTATATLAGDPTLQTFGCFTAESLSCLVGSICCAGTVCSITASCCTGVTCGLFSAA